MDVLRYVPVKLLIPVVALAIASAVGAAFPGPRADDHRRAARSASRVLLVEALLATFAVTVSGSTTSAHANLVPFRGIVGELGNVNRRLGALNLAGNVPMYVPIGLFAPAALRWGARRVKASAFALSVAIECEQLARGRSADVDDVIQRPYTHSQMRQHGPSRTMGR